MKINSTEYYNIYSKNYSTNSPSMRFGSKSNGFWSISFTGKKDYTQNEKSYFNFKKRLSRMTHKLDRDERLAEWNFYINSTNENEKIYNLAFKKRLNAISSPKTLKRLINFNEKKISDSNLQKSLNELIKDYKDNVINAKDVKELNNIENKIAKKINTCRGEIDGKAYSNSYIGQLLEDEKDIEVRKKLYHELQVKGADLIADDIIGLVQKRNAYAKKNGYENYFSYKLKETHKVDEEKLFKLLDDLDKETSEIYTKINDVSDEALANTFNIKSKDLRPYHYGLVLESSPFKEADKYVKDNDLIVKSAIEMYKKMGWDILKEPILLDVFPRNNKNQHGFCFDIDTNKDIRILANLRNDLDSIGTLNHELGHAVYNLGISSHLPYFKRDYPTSAMTEAIAKHMESLPYREKTYAETLNMPMDLAESLEKLRCKRLVRFVRNHLVYTNFEKELYKNPNQDIKKLWYELEKKYLNRNIPEVLDNRWASVPHFLSHPGYLQNYLRAEIIAAQIYEAATKRLGPLTKNNKSADFFRKAIFRLGDTLSENELIEKATGKELNAVAFLNQIKKAATLI